MLGVSSFGRAEPRIRAPLPASCPAAASTPHAWWLRPSAWPLLGGGAGDEGISRVPPERHRLGTGFAQGQRGGRKVVERRIGQAFFERASNGLRRSFVTSRRPHARRRPSVGWVCRIGCRAGGKYGLPALSAVWSSVGDFVP